MAGNDGWPEFSIPDVGDGGGAQASAPGDTGSPAPAAAAGEGGADGGTKPPVAGSPSAGEENIPKYRLDELTARYDKLEETNRRLMLILERYQPQAKPEPGAGVPPDPDAEKKQRIWNQLVEINPKLAQAIELAESAEDIKAALAQLRAEQTRTAEEWDDHAKQVLTGIHDQYAKLLSDGKKLGKDLPEETRQTITDNFVAWVMKDPSGERVKRYNRRDTTLSAEFVNDFKRTFIEPWRRQDAAGDAARARRVQNLPVGGGTASPLGTPPPKPKADEDEDEVFHRGFRHTMMLKEQAEGHS